MGCYIKKWYAMIFIKYTVLTENVEEAISNIAW